MAHKQSSQFRVLYRDFLVRMVDLELISSHGDIQKLLVQFTALIAAFSVTFAFYVVRLHSALTSPAMQERAAASESEFMIATTMVLSGLLAILAWNSVFPDRRDCLVLGLLPVPARTILLAKLAAIGTALGVTVGAVNSFTGLCLPFMSPHPLRSLPAYWLTVVAAGAFVFCGALALQGLVSHLLPHRVFMRVSGVIQLTAFFVILGGFFLKPPLGHTYQSLLRWSPSFWFFSMYRWLAGDGSAGLGLIAAWGTAAVCVVAIGSLLWAYARSMRRMVEQPEIAPAVVSRGSGRLGPVISFIARTMARSRQHRLLLAAYGGIGLAIALEFTRDLLYGNPSNDPLYRGWDHHNWPFLAGSYVLLFFAVIGARAVFAMPASLAANWVFRMTVVRPAAAYFRAVRKSIYLLTVGPLWILSAALAFALWPFQRAAEHVALLVAVGILLVETSLHGFRKIPFTCSYLPGKANLKIKLGVYGGLLFFLVALGVSLELGSMHNLVGFAVLFGLLSAAAIWARLRWRAFAASPYNTIQFEEVDEAEFTMLDLRGDGGGPSLPAYVEPEPAASWGTRFSLLSRDFQHSARSLRKSPGTSAAVAILFAVGIGVNTTIYSMIHGVLTKPAPGVTADRLVSFGVSQNGHPMDPGENSFASYLQYTDNIRSFESIAASVVERFNMTVRDGSSYRLRGELVTGNYLHTLGVRIVKGRDFTEEEVRGAAPLPAIIDWFVWQNQFQAAPDVLGQSIRLNGQPATIVGVTLRGFHGTMFAPTMEVCVPVIPWVRLRNANIGRGVILIGRLVRGVSIASAQAEFDTLTQNLQESVPENQRRRVLLKPYSATAFGPVSGPQTRRFMAIVMGVAILTLLIVCANVASLTLGRAVARQREIALRLALGASAGRIARLMFAEGLMLALVSATAAWLMASWVTRLIPKLAPQLESGASATFDLTPDWTVVFYTLLLAVAASVLSTIGPAWRAMRRDPQRGIAVRRSRSVTMLVAAQVAFSLVLLIGGGLAWRSLSLMESSDLYFNKDHVLLAAVNTSGTAPDPLLLERIRRRLSGLPNVVSVSWAIASPPHSHPWMAQPARALGGTTTAPTDGTYAGPGYLETLQVPIMAGRGISANDLVSPNQAAVINQKMAEALWPGEPAVGKQFVVGRGQRPVEVVGVVPDGAFNGVGLDGSFNGLRKAERRPFIFMADTQGAGWPERTFHLRYTGDLNRVIREVRAAVAAEHAGLAVFSLRTMQAGWDDFTSPIRFMFTLLSCFGMGSLALAAVGLYAVVAFHTARRTREFGIRMALGASPGDMVRTVVREGLVMTAIGAGIGFALCALAGRAFANLLFGVTPADPVTYAAVITLLAGVSAGACYIPARRAARIDPIAALREE
jgi:predicted permease